MKTMRLICLALLCVGATWVGYEVALYFGSAIILFFAAFPLAALSGALFCAPEGDEQADGFHVRAPKGRRGLVDPLPLFQGASAARMDVTFRATCRYKSEA